MLASLRSRLAGADRFNLISWAVTFVLVGGLLAIALQGRSAAASPAAPAAQDTPSTAQPAGTGAATPSAAASPAVVPPSLSPSHAIERELQLKTNIPERPRYEAVTYRISQGDAMLAIAEKFDIKPESILYVNGEVLEDNPHNIRPGMELLIPPVDGLYYTWEESDTLEAVADKFDAEPEAILNFPGNEVDLTNPEFQAGTRVMIPGGSRELRDWTQDLQTAARSNTGTTGTSDFGANLCGGGAVGSGFGWPANSHQISGNGYGPGHLGIDIAANEGDPVYAASAGVVTMAQGGYNYGYGNVVQIDHGNGYVTVYAHLSQYNVAQCMSVGQGTLVGLAGSTGNAFGSHLHFEIRFGGSNINPLDIVQ